MIYFLFAILCAYFLWSAAVYFVNPKTEDLDDYLLSNRKVGVFSLTMTFLATQFGGATIIGGSEAAAMHGWNALLYSGGTALGFLMMSISGFGARLRNMNVCSLPEIFSEIYQCNYMRKISAFLSVICLGGILIALGVSSRKLFYSIGLENEFFFIIFWSSVVFYTAQGGLKAVIGTDKLQILIVLVIFLLVAMWMFVSGEYDACKNFSINETVQFSYLEWLLMPLLFTVIGQDMGQRCSSGIDSGSVACAAFFSAILMIIVAALPVALGMISAANGISAGSDGVLLAYLKSLDGFSGQVVFMSMAMAILMAIISTVDSLVCAVSLNVSYDIFNLKRDSNQIGVAKNITLALGILCILLSYFMKDIIPLILKAYGLYVCALFFPIFCAVFACLRSKWGMVMSFCGGFGSFIFLQFVDAGGFAGEYVAVLPLCISGAAYTAGYAMEHTLQLRK